MALINMISELQRRIHDTILQLVMKFSACIELDPNGASYEEPCTGICYI